MAFVDGAGSIDLGSTTTRCTMASGHRGTANPDVRRVQRAGACNSTTGRYTAGEWSSTCCPFDFPYPVGHEATKAEYADKRKCSLKSIIWFLANEVEQDIFTKALKDHNDMLSTRAAKTEFHARLEDMVVRHLAVVADRLFLSAHTYKVILKQVSVSVPNLWGQENYQKVMVPIMNRAMHMAISTSESAHQHSVVAKMGELVYTVFEIENQAQYWAFRHSHVLAGFDILITIDIGGHFASANISLIGRDDGYEHLPILLNVLNRNFGVRGGSQLWEEHIRPYIDAQVNALNVPVGKKSALREVFLNTFFVEKQVLNKDLLARRKYLKLQGNIMDSFPHDYTSYEIQIRSEDVLAAWRKAFLRPIAMAAECMMALPTPYRRNAVVVVSGGSSKNIDVLAALKQKADELEIAFKASSEIEEEGSKWMVSEGAARSLVCSLGPKAFMQRGSAFAVQTFDKAGKPEGDPEVLFHGSREEDARSFGDQRQVEIKVLQSSKFRLVCDPLYHRDHQEYPENRIRLRTAYDVWDFSLEASHEDGAQETDRIPHGRYVIKVESISFDDNGVDATLRLLLAQKGWKPPIVDAVKTSTMTLRERPQPRSTASAFTFDLPLSASASDNLLHVNHDQVRGLVWKRVHQNSQPAQNGISPERKRQRLSMPSDGPEALEPIESVSRSTIAGGGTSRVLAATATRHERPDSLPAPSAVSSVACVMKPNDDRSEQAREWGHDDHATLVKSIIFGASFAEAANTLKCSEHSAKSEFADLMSQESWQTIAADLQRRRPL